MLFDDVTILRGVGPSRKEAFARLGIVRVIDLVTHMPRRYEDRRIITPINRLRIETVALIRGKLRSIASRQVRPHLTHHKALLSDETGSIQVNFFNQDYILGRTKAGDEWVVFGKCDFFGKEKNFALREVDITGRGTALGLGTIMPYYPATAATPQRYLRRVIGDLVRTFARRDTAPPKSAIPGAGGRAGASVLGGDRMSQIAEGTAWPPAAAPPLSAIHGAGGTAWPPAAASPPGVFVGLGISTGGPPALMKLLAALGPGTPPMAIVQHMPEGFVPSFTARLNAASALEVVVAKDDMVIPAGVCVVAPGDRHLEIVRRGDLYRARLRDGEKVSGHRPSADLLLRSIAESAGEKGLGVLMTGMGRDGADGMAAIKRAGGRTIAQDQESSVVYGMPRAAVEEGNADRILPLEEIAGGIMTAFRK
jgi:chemotaxis response regulator CheB